MRCDGSRAYFFICEALLDEEGGGRFDISECVSQWLLLYIEFNFIFGIRPCV